MYCDNCHRQSPDNFVNCPYCSAPLKNQKRKKPRKFVRKRELKKPVSFKTTVIITAGVAFLLTVSAIITGIVTGSKPDTVVKKMVNAIQNDDAQLYYSLYDDRIIEYYKENWYFADEETFEAVTEPLRESREFYSEKCGENFKLDCKITNITEISESELEEYKDYLATSFDYKKFPSKMARVDFEIEAKGDSGKYKSVYEDFVCIKLGGKWYIQPIPADVIENNNNNNVEE